MTLFENLAKGVGIDLGTANTLVYLKGRGLVVEEPSLVAINNRTGQIIAIGSEAKKMLDRTPAHISLIKPLMNGVISDFETTEEILKHFLKNIKGQGPFSRYQTALISIPTNLTEVERKSVEDAARAAGIARVFLVEEPLATAIGARLPVEEATTSMVVNIGGGTTEISMISVGGAVISKSLKIGGQKLNDDIIKYIKDEFRLLIGEPTAEELKISIGSAIALDEKLELPVRGRDMATGLPKEILVKNNHIRASLQKSIKSIAESVKTLIETAPPELVGDILQRGIYLAGGGSLLRGLDKFLEKEITVNIIIVDEPLTAVARGLGVILEDLPHYQTILSNQQKPRPVNF